MKIVNLSDLVEPERIAAGKIEAPSMGSATSLVSIERQTGTIDRWRANRAASRQAGEALSDLRTRAVLADARIAATGLAIAEVRIKTSLVESSMIQIGAQAIDLNAKTAAVQQRLTAASHGEVVAHLQNRGASFTAFKSLESDGRITGDEAATLRAIAETDTTNDIRASLDRNRKAKDVVETLHGCALAGIARAKDSLN